MLGVKRQAHLFQRRDNPPVHGLQALDRREQAEGAAACRPEQFPVRCGDLVHIGFVDVVDNENPRLCRVIERRFLCELDRRVRQVIDARALARDAPVFLFVIGAVAQRRRGDRHAVCERQD